ncbi:MAG: TolC family protein [Wenzhouxiangellaceae bacterium]|nr:TolC family protein [Wenzhouxiangellaceae bacterium]
MTRTVLMITVLSGLLAVTGRLHAQPLTEIEAVRLGLEAAALRDWSDASLRQARSRTLAAGRMQNPEFEFSDESLDLPGGNTERYYWLRQPLDLTGRRGLERKSARAAEGLTSAEIEQVKRRRATSIRQLFYQALRLRREHEAMAEWQARLALLVVAVSERVEAGDASSFDRLRIERELALLDSRLATRRAEQVAARQRLFGLLGSAPRALTGTLLPGPAPAVSELAAALARHPELQRLQAGAEADRYAAQAAARESWPEFTVGVGVRQFEDAALSQTGGVFSVGVELPLFDRGQQRRDAANAGAGAKSAEAALLRVRLEAQARALLEERESRRKAAEALRDDIGDGANTLPEMAEAAYRAGEMGVMALIDAWQTEMQLRLQAVELEHAARVAAIELLHLTGE